MAAVVRGAFAALLLLLAFATHALEVPYLTGRVTDDAELLDAEARRELGELLAAHERKTGNQVVVLTIASLEGENLDEFTHRVFNAWGLGQKGKDNGVLLLVAPAERRLRIEVGYGLEGQLTDVEAGRIIRNLIVPAFRDGDFARGIGDGARAIVAKLEGQAVAGLEPGAAPGGAQGDVERDADRDSAFDGPDLSLPEKILFGAFIFGIIGLFTIIGVLTPGMGWFLYLFLIPFWAMFPLVVLGTTGTLYVFVTYLVAFPIAKLVIARLPWHRKASRELQTKGQASVGGFVIDSGGGRSGSGSSWSSGRSGGGGFSGGGGSSGGGGASGSW
jgi:uncharacterized protein